MRHLIAVMLGTVALPACAVAADWKPLATELLKQEKTGFGGLCGVLVDHTNGHLYVDLSDDGTFRSTDHGKTWERFGKAAFKGRTEVPGCFQLDPTGKTKRLLMPLVYGVPISVGTTDAADWRTLDKATTHVDWCAADWTDPDMKFVLTLKHESGGVMLLSRDAGKSFREVGKGYGPAWVFDADTAVVVRPKPQGGLVRTTDGGKTWVAAGTFTPNSYTLPRWHDGALYWLADGALLKTTDKAATWEKVGAVKDGRFGPVFGKDAKHLFVLTGAGVIESTDGATWGQPIAPPKELKGVGGLTWVDYDPTADVLYIMKMGSDLYALDRGK